MRDQAGQSRKTYNRLANAYEESFEGRFSAPLKQELIKQVRMGVGQRILDVACGTGTLLAQFVELYSVEAYGIDIAENMVAVASANHPDISFRVGDCSSLDFPDGFFHVVTVCAAFHHFSDPKKFIDEASRVLTKDGRLYIAEVYVPPVAREVMNVIVPLLPSGDVRVYSPREIRAMLEGAGLSAATVNKNRHIQIASATKL